jgi:hypothetical protein
MLQQLQLWYIDTVKAQALADNANERAPVNSGSYEYI